MVDNFAMPITWGVFTAVSGHVFVFTDVYTTFVGGFVKLLFTMLALFTHISWQNENKQNSRHVSDAIFKSIFLNDEYCILIKIHWSLLLGLQLT